MGQGCKGGSREWLVMGQSRDQWRGREGQERVIKVGRGGVWRSRRGFRERGRERIRKQGGVEVVVCRGQGKEQRCWYAGVEKRVGVGRSRRGCRERVREQGREEDRVEEGQCRGRGGGIQRVERGTKGGKGKGQKSGQGKGYKRGYGRVGRSKMGCRQRRREQGRGEDRVGEGQRC